MNVIVVGSGGREHALAWKMAQSENVEKIYVIPGNAGTSLEEKCVNVNISDNEGVLNFALKNRIDLTVVGPEKFLADGIVDLFEERGLKIFGPTRKPALLESSKVFAKKFARKYGVQTAEYLIFDDFKRTSEYLQNTSYPKVIKADGLASGKGVFVVNDKTTAIKTIKMLMEKKILSDAGKRVVIEDYLNGFEVSIMAFIDGKNIIPMISAMDYKKAYDNDIGPNTGGMGALAPNPYLTKEITRKIDEKIIKPTLKGIKEEKIGYRGLLYFGILVQNGEPYLLEYNVRFGDPETQAVLPILENDFTEVLLKVIDKRVDEIDLKWKKETSCCVVAASFGYPASYKTGNPIEFEDGITAKVFHAGTKLENKTLKTYGGRVLSVVGIGREYEDARNTAYANIKKIKFPGIWYRKDIGIQSEK